MVGVVGEPDGAMKRRWLLTPMSLVETPLYA
jgi:hypothetical protein